MYVTRHAMMVTMGSTVYKCVGAGTTLFVASLMASVHARRDGVEFYVERAVNKTVGDCFVPTNAIVNLMPCAIASMAVASANPDGWGIRVMYRVRWEPGVLAVKTRVGAKTTRYVPSLMVLVIAPRVGPAGFVLPRVLTVNMGQIVRAHVNACILYRVIVIVGNALVRMVGLGHCVIIRVRKVHTERNAR